MVTTSDIKIALRMLRLFFYRIIRRKWYLPKIPEITVDELFDRLNSNDLPIILDLRDKADFEGRGEGKYEQHGHIRDSKRISILKLSSQFDILPKDREIVTICPGGGMSLVGAELLIKAGFKNAKSLKGGIWAWAKKEYPLIKVDVSTEEIEDEESEAIEIKEKIPFSQYLGKIDQTIDARNLRCPEPVLRSKKTLKSLKVGQVLEILTTDPGSQRDIPSWARVTGQELLVSEERGPKDFRFLVRKQN
jgi:tRNA 2-thiouridine synthesizing protein A